MAGALHGCSAEHQAPNEAGLSASDSSTPADCFYPFSIATDPDPARPGCACEGASSYCVHRAPRAGELTPWTALVCREGLWAEVRDGPCGVDLSQSACEHLGGVGVKLGIPTMNLRGCPPGHHRLGRIIDTDADCCAPLEVHTHECVAAGFHVLADPRRPSVPRSDEPFGCPEGEQLRAYIDRIDLEPGGLCCEPLAGSRAD